MKAIRKRKKKGVSYDAPYQGAEGSSKSREGAKKMWSDNASAEELQLGYKLMQGSDGNFIVRTRLSSKA